MKILHVAVDEKFIPFAQKVFETVYPGGNRYRVMATGGPAGRFVKPADGVEFVSRAYWFSDALKRDLAWADCLVVHGLNQWFARAIEKAPRDLLVVWHGSGADYYDLLDGYADRLHLPLTSDLLAMRAENIRRKAGSLAAVRHRLKVMLERMLFGDWTRRALPRIDVISMLPDEFRILQRSQPGVRARFHQLYYSSAEESFMPGVDAMTGPDILLGNSATPANNHLDAFQALRRIDLDDRRIIVPLSYGDQGYAEAVCREGTRLFGSRFVPILEYLTAAAYYRQIASCGFVFMNHLRQQATANVSVGLLKGAKVFLRKENLLHPFYRGLGARVDDFPTATEPAAASELFSALSDPEKALNRRVVMEYWAMDTVLMQARLLADMVQRA